MKYIMIFVTLLLIISCGEDDVITTTTTLSNETISGQVTYESKDSCCLRGTVEVIDLANDSTVLATATFSGDGLYSFDNVLPEQDSLILVAMGDFEVLTGVDKTPDGDVGEDDLLTPYIPVYLQQDEDDDGNDFVVVEKPCSMGAITGSVVGVAGSDTTLLDLVSIELYEQKDDGSPGILVDSRFGSGSYSFSVRHLQDYLLRLDANGSGFSQDYTTISNQDQTPDGDETAGNGVDYLSVSLDSCETDSDNFFYVQYAAADIGISGVVLADTDQDGSGDIPVEGLRIELYERNAQLVPMGPLLDAANTDLNGVFTFSNVDPGEYVLYYIGDPLYSAISATDLSPESGEPTAANEIHLPVDVVAGGDADTDNTYVVQASSSCDDQPVILPYPAINDTSIICTYEELAIYATDDTGTVLTSAGGLYELIWTDLLTGEVMQGDWVYHKTNHPIRLDITYPNGCTYKVYYHRQCDQDFAGSISLVRMTTGFGPIYDYNAGEVVWDIDPFNEEVAIQHDISLTDNPNLVPAGLYSYEQTSGAPPYNITLTSTSTGGTYDVGVIRFWSGQLVLDAGIALDGVGQYFERN